MHKLKIVMTGPGRGTVYLDDEPVKCVTGIKFFASVDNVSSVVLTLNVLDAIIEAEGAEVEKILVSPRRVNDDLVEGPLSKREPAAR